MSHLQNSRIVIAPKFAAYQYLTSPEKLSEQLKGLIEVTWQNPGIELKAGSEFLYTMSRFGVEQPIRFVVDRMVVGSSFTYRQVSGLFLRFIHTIRFEEKTASETVVTDMIDYDVPFGLVGRLADDVFIKSDLKRILNYRLDNADRYFEQKETQDSSAVETAM